MVVSSGLIRSVKENDIGKTALLPALRGFRLCPNTYIHAEKFESTLAANSGADGYAVYGATKFIQLLGAHFWRRELKDSATVLAVSPGLVIGTGLGRYMDEIPDLDKIPDKLTVEQGTLIVGYGLHPPQELKLKSPNRS